jgi:hypothetical protein
MKTPAKELTSTDRREAPLISPAWRCGSRHRRVTKFLRLYPGCVRSIGRTRNSGLSAKRRPEKKLKKLLQLKHNSSTNRHPSEVCPTWSAILVAIGAPGLFCSGDAVPRKVLKRHLGPELV